jgi:hypothetical protein
VKGWLHVAKSHPFCHTSFPLSQANRIEQLDPAVSSAMISGAFTPVTSLPLVHMQVLTSVLPVLTSVLSVPLVLSALSCRCPS